MNTPGACERLADALEPFWGATDQTEWPRTMRIPIAPELKVVSAEEGPGEPFPSAKVTSCVLARFKALKFPEPLGGGVVKVNYPFVFQAAQ